MEDQGLYCSTAGGYFHDKESLTEHYKSDFHRYNLKRKIAGLPPVTREWYEARKAQLLAAGGTGGAPVQRVWFDPLTRKKFYSENTYLAFTRSKKYQDLVKKSGQPAPAAVVTLRRVESDQQQQQQQPQQQQQGGAAKPAGYKMRPAVKSAAAATAAGTATAEQQAAARMQVDGKADAEEAEEDGVDEGSDWETASEEEMETHEQWEEWDVRRSLFDNHMSASMEANLEYMYRNFGFVLPEPEFLVDPEGLIKYLGAKLQYGHVPLYESGDNENAKQFASLHAVQRHMVDTNQCRMLYDDNEDEYEDFYDYSGQDEEMAGTSGALIVSDAAAGPSAAYELVLAAGDGGRSTTRVIGSREFARYYRQRPRLGDQRQSVEAARVLAQYRRMAVPLLGDGSADAVEKKRVERQAKRMERQRLQLGMKRNILDKLPKNVPY